MKKLSYQIVAIDAVILAFLLIIAFSFCDFDAVGFYFWCGIGFAVVTVFITIASVLGIKPKTNNDLVEVNAIPIIFTHAYMALALVVNIIFMVIGDGEKRIVPVSVNLLLLCIFFAVRIFTNPYGARVKKQVEVVRDKIRPIQEIRVQMNEMLALSKDAEIRQKVLKIKENVDYANNTSDAASITQENIFLSLIGDINAKMRENRDKNEILADLESADLVWKNRNVNQANR